MCVNATEVCGKCHNTVCACGKHHTGVCGKRHRSVCGKCHSSVYCASQMKKGNKSNKFILLN